MMLQLTVQLLPAEGWRNTHVFAFKPAAVNSLWAEKKKKKDRDREGILMTFVHFHIILKSLTSAVKQRASNNWTISFKFIELLFLFFFHLLHPAHLQHATHSLCMLSTHHPLFKASSIFGVILCPSAIRVWLYGASGRCWCEGIDVSGAVKSPESRHWN